MLLISTLAASVATFAASLYEIIFLHLFNLLLFSVFLPSAPSQVYFKMFLSPAASSAFSSLLILHVVFYTDLTPFNLVLLLFPWLIFLA